MQSDDSSNSNHITKQSCCSKNLTKSCSWSVFFYGISTNHKRDQVTEMNRCMSKTAAQQLTVNLALIV